MRRDTYHTHENSTHRPPRPTRTDWGRRAADRAAAAVHHHLVASPHREERRRAQPQPELRHHPTRRHFRRKTTNSSSTGRRPCVPPPPIVPPMHRAHGIPKNRPDRAAQLFTAAAGSNSNDNNTRRQQSRLPPVALISFRIGGSIRTRNQCSTKPTHTLPPRPRPERTPNRIDNARPREPTEAVDSVDRRFQLSIRHRHLLHYR